MYVSTLLSELVCTSRKARMSPSCTTLATAVSHDDKPNNESYCQPLRGRFDQPRETDPPAVFAGWYRRSKHADKVGTPVSSQSKCWVLKTYKWLLSSKAVSAFIDVKPENHRLFCELRVTVVPASVLLPPATTYSNLQGSAPTSAAYRRLYKPETMRRYMFYGVYPHVVWWAKPLR